MMREKSPAELRRDLVLAIDAWRRGDKRVTAHLLGQVGDATLALGTLTALIANLLDTCNAVSSSGKAGDDLMAAWKAREQGQDEEPSSYAATNAREWLETQLRDGQPRRVTVLRARAVAAGFTFSQLRGAAVRIGVIAKPNTSGNVPHRTWQLPRTKVRA